MEKTIKICVIFLIVVAGSSSFSYSRTIGIEELVDKFYNATDLQRDQMLKDSLGKEIAIVGKASNVDEYDFFDVVNDIKGIYYQVSLEQQKTKNNIPYQAILLFKDRNKVKDIDKGESLLKEGKIIRILDERLQITVWLFCGELADNDKALFEQN